MQTFSRALGEQYTHAGKQDVTAEEFGFFFSEYQIDVWIFFPLFPFSTDEHWFQ